MESILAFITENASYAHWAVFGLLILAGFNVPISEDLMIILSGVLAGTVVPENVYKLFIAVFLGCYLSDWIAYGLGRRFGKHLLDIPWFARFVDQKRMSQVQKYFSKHGFLTLLIGRFIPFGVRNCIFISAGMAKMPFLLFILGDGIACLISNSILFAISYTFAEMHEEIAKHLKTFNLAIFSLFATAICCFLIYRVIKKRGA